MNEQHTDRSVEAAKDMAASMRQEGENIKETLKQHAEEVGQQARREMHRLKDEAGEEGVRMLDERRLWMAEEVGGIADALRTSADQLDEQEQISAARYMDRAADALERFSSHLSERDINALMQETRDLIRREPVMVIGGAVAIGFVLSRFLKSSGGDHAMSRSQPSGF